MKLEVVKTETFDLKPFGKFSIKLVKNPDRCSPRTIPLFELKMEHESAYPLTEEQESEFVKAMIKAKTDIFTDGSYFGFFTRTNSGLTRVYHPKLQQYREDLEFRKLVDGESNNE